jgi:hypothetical protein
MFLGHLAEWSTGVCIVVFCTSRPELFEAHPHWAGGLANATTLALRPLTADETRPLVDALLAESKASGGAIDAVVDRCGGDPLYAQEYARLLAETDSEAIAHLDMPASAASGDERALDPASHQPRPHNERPSRRTALHRRRHARSPTPGRPREDLRRSRRDRSGPPVHPGAACGARRNLRATANRVLRAEAARGGVRLRRGAIVVSLVDPTEGSPWLPREPGSL